MDPKTTTEPATQDPGVTVTQPEEQPATAVTTPEPEPTTTPTEEPAPAENPSEEDHAAWLASKGIDLSTPEGQAKAAKSWREAEKAMTQKSQAASELAKQLQQTPVAVESDNPLVQQLAEEVIQMKRQQNIATFAASVNLTTDQELKMAQYMVENPDTAKLVNAGYMTLDQVYKLSDANTSDPTVIKQQGGKEALEKLANKQRATAPVGNATIPQPPTVDPILAVLTSD
ncbi:hypothetical protein ACFU44_13790 [Nocardia rhizosphaerihabitans]|uniref:hypothetical protein n=1 Tax=Nocardia rhizosphaerihabitans TaxID=1691570 RepID=UPI00367123E0